MGSDPACPLHLPRRPDGRVGTLGQPIGDDGSMARTIPDSTKISLHQRLLDRRRERWPDLVDVHLRFRGRFAYVDGELEGGEILPLCRLRYTDSASRWGFAIYRCHYDARDGAARRGGTAPAPVGDAYGGGPAGGAD